MKQHYSKVKIKLKDLRAHLIVGAICLLVGGVMGHVYGTVTTNRHRDAYPLSDLKQSSELAYGHAMKHCLGKYEPSQCAAMELDRSGKVPYFPQDGNYYGTWQYQYRVKVGNHSEVFDVGVSSDGSAKVYGVLALPRSQ